MKGRGGMVGETRRQEPGYEMHANRTCFECCLAVCEEDSPGPGLGLHPSCSRQQSVTEWCGNMILVKTESYNNG